MFFITCFSILTHLTAGKSSGSLQSQPYDKTKLTSWIPRRPIPMLSEQSLSND